MERGRTRGTGSWFAFAWLVGGLAASATATAQGTCPGENDCTFEKPNILIVMDYSSSMVGYAVGNPPGPAYFPTTQMVTKRWDAELDAVSQLLTNVEFTDNMHIGLARFAHDPNTTTTGTTLGNDTSDPKITDGFALDIGVDDGGANYLDCNPAAVQAELTALAATPPPLITGSSTINDTMGTWTKGALDSALAYITAVRARHPGDMNREWRVILMTDGAWNCADSFTQADCDSAMDAKGNQNPAPSAAALLTAGVPVYVVAFGDPGAAASLMEVAAMGGTTAPIDATDPAMLNAALESVLSEVRDMVVVPECVAGLPRVMIIMDASSSMIVGNTPGATNWDKARYALAGNPAAPNPADPGYVQPIFDRTVTLGASMVAIEDVVHIGLLAYNLQTVQQLMLQYAPCARDNIQWAMNPYTSCEAPGCTDPYTDPAPIDWTFKDSNVDPVVVGGMTIAPFAQETFSFMPDCNPAGLFGGARCLGTIPNTFTGEGIQAASDNITTYKNDVTDPFNVDPTTPFINILVTDGQTSGGSADPTATLTAMNTAGIPTYVIGFGTAADLDEATLNAYAVAGGTGPTAITVDPTMGQSADTLADAIAGIIGGLNLDPCCQLNDCSVNPEPPLPLCGNAKVDTGEACDLGANNGVYDADGTSGTATCNATCTVAQAPYCGDSLVTDAEVCDDGADNGTYDHCVADCSAAGPTCGDGNTDAPDEVCDDANNNDTDACRNACDGSCGDGTVNGSEVCDDGTNDGKYGGCKSDCSARAPYCGDGIVNGSEVCDDGTNDGSYGGCKKACKALGPSCGDGTVNGTEACDDGNTTAGDGCSATCTEETMATGGAMATGGTTGAAGVPAMAGTSGGATGGMGGVTGTGGAGGSPLDVEGMTPKKKDSGCGCRVPGATRHGSGADAVLLALLAGLVFARRRRARHAI